MKPIAVFAILSFTGWSFAAPLPPATQKTDGDRMLEAYFQAETASIAKNSLGNIKTLDDWTSRHEEYRRQLSEMLGLYPAPPRTDLKPTITGKLDHPDFTVEKLHFQSRPGLYVTANLYIPKNLTAPAPAILYVCGHSPVKKDGVSYGNKTAYQHHGAWFARNGYVCLIPDSLEFGEIDGIHHGLYRLQMWDWLSRGYTPAGVETWNAIRCLDYLQSRPEVDRERLGMTGRSGGGAYTWFTAALDERVKVAVPVAGITDLTNHVVDGTIEGHCDCMFMINTYRWDFPQVAALIAPRPLLISNSDKDTIFLLDGVIRLHSKVRDIYKLYKAEDKLGLLITEGPHNDTQDLQVPAFRWFNRFLKNDKSDLKDALTQNFFQPHELRVFPVHGDPADAINMQIQESFISQATSRAELPTSEATWRTAREKWMNALKEKTFAGWPAQPPPINLKTTIEPNAGVISLAAYDFTSQDSVQLRLYVARHANAAAPGNNPPKLLLKVLDHDAWLRWLATMRTVFSLSLSEELRLAAGALPPLDEKAMDQRAFSLLAQEITPDQSLAWIAPRGVGLTAVGGDAKHFTQIRRRFALLGQTLDGMRVWDVNRAIQAARTIPGLSKSTISVEAEGDMAAIALYAALFDTSVSQLDLWRLPPSHRDGADLLNVLQTLDMPEAVALAADHCNVRLHQTDADHWDFPLTLAARLGWPPQRLEILKIAPQQQSADKLSPP